MSKLTASPESLQAALNAVEVEAEKKRCNIHREYSIRCRLNLPETGGYAPANIHHSRLYGSDILVWHRMQRYASIAEGKSPDSALLRSLLEQFPALSVSLVKGTHTSILADVDLEDHAGKGKVTPLGSPYTIRLSWEGNYVANVEWHSVVDGLRVRFAVELPISSRLGIPYVDIDPYSKQLKANDIRLQDVRATRIRWAGAGGNTPRDFTIYWAGTAAPTVDELCGFWD